MVKQVLQMNYEEKEELINIIKNDLKDILSEQRFNHCVSTMEKAEELSEGYNIDIQIVKLTALAHDIAKEISKNMEEKDYEKYAEENNLQFSENDKEAKAILHGIIGSDIVKKKYGFSKEMQDAIYYHSTAREEMTLLDKIIFLADKSEKLREGEDAEKLRKIIKEEGFDKAILWDIDYYTIPRMIQKQRAIHPNTIYARNSIIKKMNMEA